MMSPADRSADHLAVLDAAAQADISDYEIFRRAYLAWFGQAPSDAYLERLFGSYLYGGAVPHWVRQYVRSRRQVQTKGQGKRRLSWRTHLFWSGLVTITLVAACVFFLQASQGVSHVTGGCYILPCLP